VPEIRKDPITGRWVVFSPERLRRPNQFEFIHKEEPEHASNPFAVGHESFTPPEVYAIREPDSSPNQPGWKVRVVPNRFPALRVEGNLNKEAIGFYDKMNGIGAHEVVIETPDPNQSLEQQPLSGILDVLKSIRTRMLDLMKDSRFKYLMVFKNVGAQAGASQNHAHTQIIALPVIPLTIKEKLNPCREHFVEKDRNLYEDILLNELREQERMVYENAGFGVFCPFASRFPFEVLFLPKQQHADFHACADHELVLLADALQKVLMAYRLGLNQPSYNLILHTAPVRHGKGTRWHTLDFDFRWHIEILPRMSGIAGFEFGTGFHINSVLPEEAARFLREVKVEPGKP
jgi:UDPglucose--hexose-1-phosphate uridylyltransferase